jgi:tRNA(Arg) A34 adenosine deaminase TadA
MGMEDLRFMDEALMLARQAADAGEVPVGCVIVRNGQIVGRGRNRRETGRTALGHAEIQAIAQACHGDIGVESEGEGHGSTFWIRIPCEKR